MFIMGPCFSLVLESVHSPDTSSDPRRTTCDHHLDQILWFVRKFRLFLCVIWIVLQVKKGIYVNSLTTFSNSFLVSIDVSIITAFRDGNDHRTNEAISNFFQTIQLQSPKRGKLKV